MSLRRRPSIAGTVAATSIVHARWGRADATPAMMLPILQSVHVVLSVYPPGTIRTQRAWLWIRGLGHSWLGLLILLWAVLTAAGVFGLWVGPVVVLCVAGTLWGCAARASAKAWRRTHRVHAHVTAGGSTGMSRFLWLADQLDDLDAQRHINPVEYERRWALIYEAAASSEKASDERG